MTGRGALILAALAALLVAGAAYGLFPRPPAPAVTQAGVECDSCSARKAGQKELREALARARAGTE